MREFFSFFEKLIYSKFNLLLLVKILLLVDLFSKFVIQ